MESWKSNPNQILTEGLNRSIQREGREELIDQIQAEFELSRRLCGLSLGHFTRSMWPVIEPTTPYVHGWHIDAISEHLEAVARFEITRLQILLPPRHMKSIEVSVMFPAWVWAWAPSRRFVSASYADSISIRDAVKMRDVVRSDRYQQMIAPEWQLKDDQDQKKRFENTATGFRYSTSVGGTMTGEGGDYILCDDPINAKEVFSEAALKECWEWWRTVMSTRVNDPKRSAKVIIMQRLHENDLIGQLDRRAQELGEDGDKYEKLVLPAEFQKGSKIISHTSLNFVDPRTEDGELLWPQRFGRKELNSLKTELGSTAANAQLGQNPSPGDGGLFNQAWWRDYESSPGTILKIVQFIDCAQKPGITNDYSVIATWAEAPEGYYVLDVWRGKLPTPLLQARVEDEYARWRPNAVVIEDKSAGSALIQYLQSTIIPVLAYNPTLDKVTRATAATPTVQAGKVFLPKSAKWRQDFVDEHTNFPFAANDDQVDTTSMAVDFFRKGVSNPRIRTL